MPFYRTRKRLSSNKLHRQFLKSAGQPNFYCSEKNNYEIFNRNLKSQYSGKRFSKLLKQKEKLIDGNSFSCNSVQKLNGQSTQILQHHTKRPTPSVKFQNLTTIFRKYSDHLQLKQNIQPQNSLILEMFKDKQNLSLNMSTKSIKTRRSNRKITNSSIKTIQQIPQNDDPFKQIQNNLQKRQEIRRIKTLTGLQKLSITRIKQLKKQKIHDLKNLNQREIFHTFFHTRNQKNTLKKISFKIQTKPRKFSIAQKKINYRNLSNPNTIQHSINCQKLIQNCKNLQNQTKLRKSVSLFQHYNLQFKVKCQKKSDFFTSIYKPW